MINHSLSSGGWSSWLAVWKVELSSFSEFLEMTFLTCSLPNEELRSSSEFLESSFLCRSLWNEEVKPSSEFLEMGFLTRSLWNKELSSCVPTPGFLTWSLKIISPSKFFGLGLLTCSLRDRKSRSSSWYRKTGFLTGSLLQEFGLAFCSIFMWWFSIGMPSSLSSWNFFLASSCMEWAYMSKHSMKMINDELKLQYCRTINFLWPYTCLK